MVIDRYPRSIEIIGLREHIQQQERLGITPAQDVCAAILHTSRRAWQQWERSERCMHPAFWELARIKVRMRDAHNEQAAHHSANKVSK